MRCLVILLILLVGCSGKAPSKRAAPSKPYESKWRPEPDPAPKPRPAPVKPVPPPSPPPDPAVEERRAEAARMHDEVRQRRAREREFANLPSAEKRRVTLTTDALAAKKLDQLGTADLTVIHLHPRLFPAVSPAELTQALAVCGDRKGVGEHLTSLGISDSATALRVRAAFGLAPDATCVAARAAAEEIGRLGLAGSSDHVKSFVARNPDLFPLSSAATPARAP